MKNIIATFALAGALLLGKTSQAQVNVSINIGQGQPSWAPVNNQAPYYYIPSMNAYYNVASQLYYFLSGGRWVGRRSLPQQYRNYDMNNMYKVPMNNSRPFRNNNQHRQQYSQFADQQKHDQQTIRDYRQGQGGGNQRQGQNNRGGNDNHGGNNGRNHDNQGGHDQHGGDHRDR